MNQMMSTTIDSSSGPFNPAAFTATENFPGFK
eukprot:CAMPEP_0114322516 /NCGR_PEP_ID=MMETSP0059-20121206/27282_1 /TAXON_ID=36894 /ORGANISM="Pyramimonas parkeae, Strain CCMP726" /LENGTH=31 /DNA_ID= /DNA_START= /DNA_END= /DNA_ORIENTATION=